MSASSTPASRSGQGKSEKSEPRIPKLRLSCDACAVAKVKCSKGKPECERCIENKLECAYRPSQRSGKAPRDRSRQASLSQPHSSRSSFASDRERGQFVFDSTTGLNANPEPVYPAYQVDPSNVAGIATNWGGAIHPGTMAPSNPPLMSDQMMTRTSETMATSFPPQFVSPFDVNATNPVMYGGPQEAYSNSSGTPQFNQRRGGANNISADMRQVWELQNLLADEAVVSEMSSNPASSETSGPESSTYSPQQTRTSPLNPNSCGGHECYALACSTLGSLHAEHFTPTQAQAIPPASNSWGRAARAPSALPLDDVLYRNKSAIKNVSRLLECRCSADPHMALLYASIISKILIWFKIMAGIQVSSSSYAELVDQMAANNVSGSTGTASHPGQPPAPAATFIKHDIKVGSFSVDEEHQEPMRYMLLLSELSKAGVLIDGLLKKPGNGSGRMNSSDTSSDLYTTLASWLKTELEKLSNEIKGRLHIPAPV